MSRSYKHTPYIYYEKEDTHYLNRCLRHDKLAEIPNGGAFKRYKKGFGSWGQFWDWEEAKADYYTFNRDKEYTLEEWFQCWQKWTLRK